MLETKWNSCACFSPVGVLSLVLGRGPTSSAANPRLLKVDREDTLPVSGGGCGSPRAATAGWVGGALISGSLCWQDRRSELG